MAGHGRPEHGHIWSEIPPQHSVALVLGFRNGQRALTRARPGRGRERNFPGDHCGARGEAVSPVGGVLEQVRASMRDQEQADDPGRF